MNQSQLLAQFPKEIGELASQVIEAVASLLPNAERRVYPGWQGVGFRHPDAGYVCGVFPNESLVKLYFEHGVLLDDPYKHLRGCGSQCRYLELHPGQLIPKKTIADYLNQII